MWAYGAVVVCEASAGGLAGESGEPGQIEESGVIGLEREGSD